MSTSDRDHTPYADGRPLVLRPAGVDSWRELGSALAAFAVAAVVVLYREGATRLGWTLLGLVFALPVVLTVAFLRRSALIVRPDRVVVRRIIGSRSIPRQRIARVLFAPQVTSLSQSTTGVLYLIDGEGRRLHALAAPLWNTELLHRLACCLAVPVAQPPGPVTYAEMRERYPRVVPYLSAHPLLFGLWCVLATVVASVLIGVVILAVTWE